MDVVMEFTVHPKADNQYALTGKNSISCCGIPCAPGLAPKGIWPRTHALYRLLARHKATALLKSDRCR